MTNTKMFTDLTREELVNVFKSNEKLRLEILDDSMDSVMDISNEIMYFLKEGLKDWCYGASTVCYLRVNHEKQRDFVDGVVKIQENYCFLSDDDQPMVDEMVRKLDVLQNMDMYSDEFDALEDEVTALINKVAEKIANVLTANFDGCYDHKYLLDTFLEFYIDERMEADLYHVEIDGDNYKLFKQVSYIEAY